MPEKRFYFKVYIDEKGMPVDVEGPEGYEAKKGRLKTDPIKDLIIHSMHSIHIMTGRDKEGNVFRICHLPDCRWVNCRVGDKERPEKQKK